MSQEARQRGLPEISQQETVFSLRNVDPNALTEAARRTPSLTLESPVNDNNASSPVIGRRGSGACRMIGESRSRQATLDGPLSPRSGESPTIGRYRTSSSSRGAILGSQRAVSSSTVEGEKTYLLGEKESRPSSPWTRKASTDSITAFGRNPDDSSSADSQSSSANSSNNSSLSSAEVMNEKLSTSSPLPSSSPRKTPSTGNVLSTRRPRSQTSFETVKAVSGHHKLPSSKRSISSKDFVRQFKKKGQILECSSVEDAEELIKLILKKETKLDIRQMAVVSVCKFVFPGHCKSDISFKLKNPNILALILELAMKGSLLIYEPIDFHILQRGERFARGAGGTIYAATYGGEDVVLKVSSPTDLAFDSRGFYMESTVMTIMNHTSLLPCIAAGRQGDELMMILPRYDFSLDDLVEAMHASDGPGPNIMELVKILLYVSYGLCEIHSAGLIHRDLKPANILIQEIECKGKEPSSSSTTYKAVIADFGTSRCAVPGRREVMSMNVGTGRFIAPEVHQRDHYTTAVDVFSFGIMAYEALTGRVVFEGSTINSQTMAMLEGQRPVFEEADWKILSEPLVKLIRACWAHEPEERPSMEDVKFRLNKIFADMAKHPERYMPGTANEAMDVDYQAVPGGEGGGNVLSQLSPEDAARFRALSPHSFRIRRDALRYWKSDVADANKRQDALKHWNSLVVAINDGELV